MPTAYDILANKGDEVYATHPGASVLDAVQKMNQHHLGALVVMEDDHVVGMFTERDVLRRIVGDGRDPESVKVSDVMTRDVICCEPQTDLEDVSSIMQQRRIRHLPICDGDGHLHGLISIGDVNALYASQRDAQITFLNDYVYGRA
jgi:CBS domain-containing protein